MTTGQTNFPYTYGDYSSDPTCYVNVVSAGNYVPKTVEPVTLIDGDQTISVSLAADRVFSNP